ncbi:MAG: TIGR00730 family Rossman fold protein [Sandaracinus sp.]|nr:TIGR00730 family Rossman fold protein [Sandaracinus sp.]|tara:strand:- start:243 stop:824 length:582 start_codon:yes stop_codon:yes gene_type:complete
MRAVCVYCGSNPGSDPVYLDAARALGRTIAEAGLGVVYGGARVGLMGAMADAALAAGGSVVGILPGALRDRELAHPGLTELIIVDSMHERKAMMAERADAFVALPGGLGTLEELFEVLTWAQLGIHAKPCGVLDVAGYWAPLLRFLDRSVEQGFMTQLSRDLLLAAEDPATLLDRFRAFEPAPRRQWLTATET